MTTKTQVSTPTPIKSSPNLKVGQRAIFITNRRSTEGWWFGNPRRVVVVARHSWGYTVAYVTGVTNAVRTNSASTMPSAVISVGEYKALMQNLTGPRQARQVHHKQAFKDAWDGHQELIPGLKQENYPHDFRTHEALKSGELNHLQDKQDEADAELAAAEAEAEAAAARAEAARERAAAAKPTPKKKWSWQ